MGVGGADYVAYYFFFFFFFFLLGVVSVAVDVDVIHKDKASLRGEMGELETPDVGGHAGSDRVGGESWGEGCDALGREKRVWLLVIYLSSPSPCE